MLAASGTSSGLHSGDQAQVVLSSSTSQWYLPEITSRPAEALGEAILSQTFDAVYGTGAPALAPAGLSAPGTAAATTTVGPPGIARGTSGEQSESIPSLACFPS